MNKIKCPNCSSKKIKINNSIDKEMKCEDCGLFWEESKHKLKCANCSSENLKTKKLHPLEKVCQDCGKINSMWRGKNVIKNNKPKIINVKNEIIDENRLNLLNIMKNSTSGTTTIITGPYYISSEIGHNIKEGFFIEADEAIIIISGVTETFKLHPPGGGYTLFLKKKKNEWKLKGEISQWVS